MKERKDKVRRNNNAEHNSNSAPVAPVFEPSVLLNEIHRLLMSTFQHSNGCFCVTDPNNEIIYSNHAFNTIYDYSDGELVGKNISVLFEQSYGDSNKYKGLFENASNGEFTNKKKDGTLFPVYINTTPLRNFDGIAYAVVSFHRDLTDERNIEKLYKEGQERFKHLYENSPMGIYRTTPEGKVILANPSIIKMLGYSSFEELAEKNVEQSGYTEKYSRKDFIDLLEKNGEVIGYETSWYKKNKEIVHVRENAIVVKDGKGRTIYYEGTVEDITARKNTEEALNHKLEQLQFLNFLSEKVNKDTDLDILFNEAIDRIINFHFAHKVSLHLIDENDGRLKFYNVKSFSENFVSFCSCCELWQANEYGDSSIQIPDIETNPITKDYHKVLFAESIRALAVIKMKAKDKLIGKLVLYFCEPNIFSTDDLILVETIANQIAFTIERKHNEEIIQNNEKRFRALLDRSSDIISILSKEGKVLYDTSSSRKILGKKMVGKNIFPLIHPEDLKKVQNEFLELIKNKDSIKASTFRLKHVDGSWRCTESIARNYIDDPSINGIIVNTRDITDRLHFEKELHESELRYKAIFHNNHAVMIVIDPGTGEIVDANNAACEYYGYPIEKLTSLNISDINILQTSEIQTQLKNVVERSQHFFNFKHRLADNSIRDVEVYSGPVEFQGKKYLYSIIHDLTEKKLAEKTLEDERLLFIAGPVVVFKWKADSDGITEYVSPNVSAILGYTPEEFMSDSVNFKQIIHPDDRQRLLDEISNHLKADELHYHQQYRARRKDGEYIWFDDFTHVIKNNDGDITYFHGYLMDITANKLAEEVIIKSEQKLRELNLMKDKFFSVIAHDLRSPFQGLLGMANILVEDDEITEDERKIFEQKLYEGLRTQFNFIEDLLAWSRIQRGAIEFNPEPNNLSSLIEETVSLLGNSIEKKNMHLHLDTPGNLVTTFDKNMIATVIRNLLSNAIKFSFADGDINISVLDQDNSICISIKDCGIGIDEADLNKLFRLNTHFSTRGTDGEGGTGFGLILCKDFVERHNGIITVTSSRNYGSTFSFSIPKI